MQKSPKLGCRCSKGPQGALRTNAPLKKQRSVEALEQGKPHQSFQLEKMEASKSVKMSKRHEQRTVPLECTPTLGEKNVLRHRELLGQLAPPPLGDCAKGGGGAVHGHKSTVGTNQNHSGTLNSSSCLDAAKRDCPWGRGERGLAWVWSQSRAMYNEEISGHQGKGSMHYELGEQGSIS